MPRFAIPATRTALTVLALAWGPALRALDMPNLSGAWQLNKDASDDPEKVLQEARSSGGARGGGGGLAGGTGMGRGGRGHGGGGRSGQGGDGGASTSQSAGDWFAATSSLQIKHVEPSLSITDAAGRERVVYTDGRKTEEERSHGGTTVMTASWKDGRVEMVSRPETGAKITESFSVTADGSQLTVTTKIEGGRGGGVTIRRVYDAVKASAPRPTPQARPQAPAPPTDSADDGEEQSV